MPAPCNPWGGEVGDDLSFAIPDSCSACRDDDPKKLSSAQQNDDVSNAGRQPWSNIAGLVWHQHDVEDHVQKILKLEGCVRKQNTIPHTKLSSKRMSEIPFIKKTNSGRIRFRAENRTESDALIGRFPKFGRSDRAEILRGGRYRNSAAD